MSSFKSTLLSSDLRETLEKALLHAVKHGVELLFRTVCKGHRLCLYRLNGNGVLPLKGIEVEFGSIQG